MGGTGQPHTAVSVPAWAHTCASRAPALCRRAPRFPQPCTHTCVRHACGAPPCPPLPRRGGECDHGKKIGVETPALNGGFVLCCSSGAPPQPPHPATPRGLGVRTGVPRCAKVCDGHGGGVHSWAAVCNAARNRAKPCNAAQCRAKPQSCRTPRGIAALCDVTGSCATPCSAVELRATSCNVMQRHAASCSVMQ